MLLELGRIINVPGEVVPFKAELDLSELEFGACRPASEAVTAEGEVKNQAGVLVLSCRITTTLHCVCDRCTKEFTSPFELSYQAVLVRELASEENDDSVFLLQGDCVDLDEVVSTAFVLNMEQKTLCSDDCKGLCPRCGADLNEGDCGCGREIDPRLAALSQLLRDNNEQE